ACEDVDNDFYWVTTEFKDESNILALAANTEATLRHYVSSLSSVDNLVAIGSPPSDTYGKLDELGYERSSGIYHQDADNYPELGMIARFAIYEPGTMDYYAKTLPGFGVARNSDTGAILTSS